MQRKLSRFGLVALAAGAVLALAGPAGAMDDAVPGALKAAPGVPVMLAVESSGRPDCSVGPVPETRVVVPPAHGELTHAEGRLRLRDTACPAAAGYVLFYEADSDFNGDDMVTIEVSSMGMKTTYAFDIMVEGKTTPPDGGV